MTLLRLGFRLALAKDPRQRWRQLSVIITSGICALCFLLAGGVVHAAQQSDERIAGRSPTWATDAASTKLKISLRGMTLDNNYQFSVVWLEPAAGSEGDPSIVPPGLARLPAPGEAVLSSGLHARGLDARDFGFKESMAGTGPGHAIGRAGLSSESEGWIYARPAPGRTLGEGGALLPLRGFTNSMNRAGLEASNLVPTGTEGRVGVLWLLMAPGLALAVTGGRAFSHVRDERAATLARLGIHLNRIRLLLLLETAYLSFIGVAGATTFWFATLENSQHIPLTGVVLQPGALSLPLTTGLSLAGLAVVLTATSASIRRIASEPGSRRSSTVAWWHVLPFVSALAMMTSSRFLPEGSIAARALLFGGLILTFIGLPLALPLLVLRVARRMSQSSDSKRWLAGRRLIDRVAPLSRPASAVAMLIFLSGGAFAVYGHMIEVDQTPGSNAPLARYTANWRDVRPTDLARIRERLPEAQVLPTFGQGPARFAVFSSCRAVIMAVKPVNLPACQGDGIPADTARRFQGLTGVSPRLMTATGNPSSDGEILIIAPLQTTDLKVMQAMAPIVPAVNITRVARPKPPATGVGWLVAGWVAASFILSIALLREVGDRALASFEEDDRLQRLGLSEAEIATIQRWTLIPPVVTALPAGYAAAAAFALFGYYLGFTANYVGRITVVALGVNAAAALTILTVFALHRRAHR